MKALKYTLFALGGLILLAVIGVAIFVVTFDPNQYKGQIAAVVKEKTGRILKLEGNLKVAIFPSLGAEVGKVSLSERDPAQEFLSLDSAHLSVALLPLLHGEVIVDRVRVSGLKARVVKGKDGKFNFDDLAQAGAADKPAEKKAKEKGEKPGQAVKFDVAGVSIERSSVSYQDLKTGQQLALSDLKLSIGRMAEKADGKLQLAATAKGTQPAIDLRTRLEGNYSIDLPAQTFALSKLDGELDLSGAGLPKPVKVALSGGVRAELGKEHVGADLTSKIDDSTIKAKLAMARFSAPAYTFDIDIDRLNLDQYLPPKPKPAAGAPAGKADQGGAAKEEDAPLDLSGLKGLNANGKLQCGALQVNGLKLANLRLEVKAAGGRLDAPHSANLYEGAMTGAATLNADGNRVALKETMTNVSIGPLLRDAAQQDKLEGRGNVALDVAGGGATVGALKRSLSGSAKVNLRDGAIKGVDLGALIAKVKSLGGRSEEGSANTKDETKFTELNATFAIKNGVAHNEDLDVRAPLIRVGGAGDIDIGNSSINYVVKPALVATERGQGGAASGELAGVTVPVKLTGPFDAMRYQVDYRAVAADLAKSKAGEKAKEVIEQNRGKVEEQVRDRLKGLLGR